ncbi:phasin family protein [Desulfococcaceae bacterium HSG7]|nr:phasin family protein [Desulfococcaceae bacterium HSG7]
MIDLFKKTMVSGVGLALMAKDEAENMAQEWVSQSKMTEEEGKKFVEEILTKYGETQDKLEERVGKSVKEFLKKVDIVTGEEFNRMKKEIRELKKSLGSGKK